MLPGCLAVLAVVTGWIAGRLSESEGRSHRAIALPLLRVNVALWDEPMLGVLNRAAIEPTRAPPSFVRSWGLRRLDSCGSRAGSAD